MEETQNKRGRKPKEKFSIFSQRLSERLYRSYKNLNVIAEEMGITRQSLAQYRDGNNIPDALTLAKIADYFDVSADYLLGRTDVKSANVDLKAVCEYTGLSEKAINQLATINKKNNNAKDIISDFISSSLFDGMIDEISSAIQALDTNVESEAEAWTEYAKVIGLKYENISDLPNAIAKDYARMADMISTFIIDSIIATHTDIHLILPVERLRKVFSDYKGVSENGSNNPPKE